MKYLVRFIIYVMFLANSFSSKAQAVETISSVYNVSDGFHRGDVPSDSYAYYLRNLPLKAAGVPVRYYDGDIKGSIGIYDRVVDMDIDPVDLQQCADAVMRLRGEYLYSRGCYDRIHFNFLSDGKPRYFLEYKDGKTDYKTFRRYMKYIFSYANTSSLHDELEPVVSKEDIQIGDVFIQKGRPYGHAIIVLDVTMSIETGEKQFILAQSYMPAQETQVLINPLNSGVWYSTTAEIVNTPEWSFEWKDLRRFTDQ